MPKRQTVRIVLYIIHFWQPFGGEKHQARHYVGATKDYSRRMAEHKRGKGSKIMAYARQAGIPYVSSILNYNATFEDEKRIKRAGHYDRVCPICNGEMPF